MDFMLKGNWVTPNTWGRNVYNRILLLLSEDLELVVAFKEGGGGQPGSISLFTITTCAKLMI